MDLDMLLKEALTRLLAEKEGTAKPLDQVRRISTFEKPAEQHWIVWFFGRTSPVVWGARFIDAEGKPVECDLYPGPNYVRLSDFPSGELPSGLVSMAQPGRNGEPPDIEIYPGDLPIRMTDAHRKSLERSAHGAGMPSSYALECLKRAEKFTGNPEYGKRAKLLEEQKTRVTQVEAQALPSVFGEL